MLIPFRLSPVYKDYVWGGKKLRPQAEITAEAWVVYEEDLIMDGPYKGLSLANAIERDGTAILGSKVVNLSGKRFPLLIKLLDCADWLSLQVHPNNKQAQKLAEPNQYGKTEAWYIIDAAKNAQLICGFKPTVSTENILKATGTKELLDLVELRFVQTGDTIFIAPGTIHALGPGLLLYEIQQNSDLTYRVYDWDRPTNNGRKLHIAESIEVLNPNEKGVVKHNEEKTTSSPIKTLIACEFFSLTMLHGSKSNIRINTMGESFAVLTAINSVITIKGDDWAYQLNPLETLFIPAESPQFDIEFENEGNALLARR